MPHRLKILHNSLTVAFIPLALIVLLSGCGPRMDGSSEQKFKQSFQKMKDGLGKKDTAKLTAAIKVIGFTTLGQKMENNPAYAGMTLNAILMKKLDSKTYGGIVAMAEDSLKAGKQREIAYLQKEITELKQQKTNDRDKLKQLTTELKDAQSRRENLDDIE